jgi:hypothetical protein
MLSPSKIDLCKLLVFVQQHLQPIQLRNPIEQTTPCGEFLAWGDNKLGSICYRARTGSWTEILAMWKSGVNSKWQLRIKKPGWSCWPGILKVVNFPNLVAMVETRKLVVRSYLKV